jgi:hypothetical protein
VKCLNVFEVAKRAVFAFHETAFLYSPQAVYLTHGEKRNHGVLVTNRAVFSLAALVRNHDDFLLASSLNLAFFYHVKIGVFLGIPQKMSPAVFVIVLETNHGVFSFALVRNHDDFLLASSPNLSVFFHVKNCVVSGIPHETSPAVFVIVLETNHAVFSLALARNHDDFLLASSPNLAILYHVKNSVVSGFPQEMSPAVFVIVLETNHAVFCLALVRNYDDFSLPLLLNLAVCLALVRNPDDFSLPLLLNLAVFYPVKNCFVYWIPEETSHAVFAYVLETNHAVCSSFALVRNRDDFVLALSMNLAVFYPVKNCFDYWIPEETNYAVFAFVLETNQAVCLFALVRNHDDFVLASSMNLAVFYHVKN